MASSSIPITAASGAPSATLPASADVKTCNAAVIPEGALRRFNCCPPKPNTILDFKLHYDPNAPVRVRPAAHTVDDRYKETFELALQRMMDLPEGDPRRFSEQAAVHSAYCCGSYLQEGYPDREFQVHFSWLFFPFHRWYLYFFERILCHLVKDVDPNFAIPFWNWDNPDGMTMPLLYTSWNSNLNDSYRNPAHLPPTVIDLNYGHDKAQDDDQTDEALIKSNLILMYKQVVWGRTPKLFLGQPYKAGDNPFNGAGTIERQPHNTTHNWTGDKQLKNSEDMGNFYSAGFDPIFYAHHANVDRMWSIWKTLSGSRRKDFDNPEWLNASFVFYDENKKAVRVRVKDCLNTQKLGYVYQDVDLPWLHAEPTPRADPGVPEEVPETVFSFPALLDKTVRVVVNRPTKTNTEEEEEEEVLVIDGIEVKRDLFVKFDVFINEDDVTSSGYDKTEYAGSFVNVPNLNKHGKIMRTSLRLGISDILRDLGALDDPTVTVTLVPKAGAGGLSFGPLSMEFD